MGNKLITDKGKNEVLRLAFIREEAGGAFKYLALGQSGSKGATPSSDVGFMEAEGDNYERVKIENATDTITDKKVVLTGTFEESNLNPVTPVKITEIGLCNTPWKGESDEIFFLYSEVPPIEKNGDVSLQYSIVISID